MQDNPYATPESAGTPGSSKAAFLLSWRGSLIYSVLCVVMGVIPIYGYYTHVATDEQYTVLILMVAWVLTCGNSIVCLVLGFWQWKASPIVWLFWTTLSLLLCGLSYFGYYGIGEAVVELWA